LEVFYERNLDQNLKTLLLKPEASEKIRPRLYTVNTIVADPGCVLNHPYFRELGNNFWVKILKFFDADPGWKNSDLGSGINIPDPQHWLTPCIKMVTTRMFCVLT
jgi:hypothetical protein